MKEVDSYSDKYLDMDEASRYLGISKGRLYIKVHEGKIGYIKVGSRNYFTLDQLDDYLDKITKVIEPKGEKYDRIKKAYGKQV